MTIERIDRATARLLHEEAEAALQAIARKHGLDLKGKTTRYAEDTCKVSWEFIATVDGVEPAKRRWNTYCAQFYLTPEDFGRTFTRGGRSYEVTGIKPRAKKYPVQAKDTTGKRYKFPATVLRSPKPWEVSSRY